MKDGDVKPETAVSTSSESLLKRSFSLPLSRLKSRKDGYVGVKAHTNGNARSGEDKDSEFAKSPTKPSSHVSRFKRGIFASRSMRAQLGRKKDIRISRFNVSEIPVSNDVKEQVKKAEQHRKTNGYNISKFQHDTITEESLSVEETVGDSQKRRHTKPLSKKSRWHSKNSLVRAFSGSLKRSKEKRNGIVLKTVEIRREPNVTLGIYIKQIKRPYKTESKTQHTVIISRLVPGSAAAEQGMLKPGDEIVSINDVDIENMDLKHVAAIMDLPKILLLVVRSSGTNFGLNNNLDTNAYIANDSVKRQGSNELLSEEAAVIPSVYDNDIVATEDVPNKFSQPVTKPALNIALDEAYQLLMNTINDLDQGTELHMSLKNETIYEETNSNESNSRPSSYWDVLNNWMRPSDVGKSRNPSEVESIGENLPWEESILHAIPHFPTRSFLAEDPDYDEVAGSVFEVELQVDGFAKHISQMQCGLSGSSDSMSSNASTGLYAVHAGPSKSYRPPAYKQLNGMKLKKSMSVDSSNKTHETKLLQSSISENGRITNKNFSDQIAKSNDSIDVSDCRKNSAVTVAKRQEWFQSGQNVSKELQLRIEGTTPKATHINQQKLGDKKVLVNGKLRTSSESSNTSNLSTNAHDRKLSSNSQSNLNKTSISTEDEVEKKPTIEDKIVPKIKTGPTPKSIKSLLPSPTRSRKKKFRKRLKNLTKRSGLDSTPSPDTISPPSPCLCTSDASGTLGQYEKLNGLKNTSNIINRYNLDTSHQRRLSRQFLLDHKNKHHPSAKPINTTEFKKYKPQNEAKIEVPPIQGSLVLTLYGAIALKKTVSEVYCVAQVDDAVTNRIRTSIGTSRSSVAWNECFEVKLEEASNLHLTLYTWEQKGQHKPLSKATIPIAQLFHNKQQGEAQKLAVRLDPRGTVYIRLSLEDPSTLVGPKVFGASLQSILDRETTALHVPLLVDKCIRQVEDRGMQVVGIYRLCGSAITKKNLRKKFEEDANSVDLSPEKYQDVNVITGILKDFLRELPQPLFPPELLEAVTASMEATGSTNIPKLSSPFDPTPDVDTKPVAASTDVLALLEDTQKLHLPAAERATLYALLNHLKKVASNQTSNKMTCQNLAVCFGPVLLGSVHMGQSKNGHDLAAAIGFKRHIQVLNYMVSNWPDEPVIVSQPEPDYDTIPFDPEYDDISRASRRTSRVSLTRRISHIFPSSIATGSSGNLLDVHEDEMEQEEHFHPVLNGSNCNLLERSSSLTNIDETVSQMEEGSFHLTDEFFVQDVEELFIGDDFDDKENEQTSSFLKYNDDGRVMLNI